MLTLNSHTYSILHEIISIALLLALLSLDCSRSFLSIQLLVTQAYSVWPLQHGRIVGKKQTVHLSDLQGTIGQVSGNEADHEADH